MEELLLGLHYAPSVSFLRFLLKKYYELIVQLFSLQCIFILSFLTSKPPVKILLLDLVNCDTVRITMWLGSVYLLPYFIVHSGFKIPFFLGPLSLHIVTFLGIVLVIYLTAGSALQYLHLHFMTVTPFGNILDENALLFVRFIVLVCSIGVSIGRTVLDIPIMKSSLFPQLANYNHKSMRHTTNMFFGVWMCMTAACALACIIFKALGWWRRKAHPMTSRLKVNTVIKFYLLLTFLLVVGAAVGFFCGEPSREAAVTVRLYISTPMICIFMPMFFVLSNRGISSLLEKRTRMLVAYLVRPRVVPEP